MPNYTDSPIQLVDGKACPCPSDYNFIISDVSDSESGRTEDGTMWKNKVGQMVKIELSWQNPTGNMVTSILDLFAPEYFTVKYFDPRINNFNTSVFYVGDRSTPMYNFPKNLWTDLKLNIIERSLT